MERNGGVVCVRRCGKEEEDCGRYERGKERGKGSCVSEISRKYSLNQ